jgi:transcriptional regulator with XRE-family HTH domain
MTTSQVSHPPLKIPRTAASPLAKRIRQAREQVGHSQRGLGVAIGLDESVASPRINQYERGVHAPGYGIISRVAAVTGFPIGYFFTEDDALAEVIALLGRLDTTGLERVAGYVHRLPRAPSKPASSR